MIIVANCAKCHRPYPTTMEEWEAGKELCNSCTRKARAVQEQEVPG